MITQVQYFAAKPHSSGEELIASDLLSRVNELCDEAERAGVHRQICPNTGSEISGSKGGSGDGGFRLPTATTGAAHSSHKEARAVDVYDPQGNLDDWITDEILEAPGLYREAPNSTEGWAHLTTRPPPSGKRTFIP